ncbi:MAG: aspartyl/asparaginyl beta-hydroxylase domain-containing protein [Acidimicrobiales bacterium]|nr:aspartyl/asparaginyl beta-hydroxylase domain-containing protein [Acidimicrobiales bacterium]
MSTAHADGRLDLRRWASRLWDAVRINVPLWWVLAWTGVLWVLLPWRKTFTTDDLPGSAVLEQHAADIRAELDVLLAEREAIPGFHEVDPGQRRLSDSRRWQVFVLRFYGLDVEANRQRCPKTAAALDQVPDVHTAFFSIFEPHTGLPRHTGAVKGIVRYHLGLIVPDSPDCWIEIGGQRHHWEEGKTLIFDDTFIHRARNDTDETRVVLFVDLVRPMPWPWLDRANRRMLDRLARSTRITDPVARAARFADNPPVDFADNPPVER